VTDILRSATLVYYRVNLADSDTTTTFCSTDEYLAPEVIQAAYGYTKMVNFWPLALLVFERCYG